MPIISVLWGFLKAIPWQIYAAILSLALILGYGHSRYERGYEVAQAEHAEDLAKQAAAAQKLRDQLEQAYLKQATLFIEKRDKEYAKRDKVIADWQSGRLRLKARFTKQTCPAASGNNAGTEAGLLDEDVQFLVREATRADAVVQQLTACQGLIKNELIPAQ